jgi:SDR family mycofactocin-dependent oxidoreductase
MSGRVQGKVVFITGAARGQGRAHAVRFAEEGASVIAVDVCAPIDGVPIELATEEDLRQTAAAVEAVGGKIVARPADVRDSAALEQVVQDGLGQFGRLDAVIANAGTSSPGRALELTDQQWQTIIDINLTGVWRTCKAAVPAIIDGGRGGSVILTSSVGGVRGYENIANYIAAKHGVVGLMRSLALELAPHWIRVNTLHPGSTRTALMLNDITMQKFRPELAHPTEDDLMEVTLAMNVLPTAWIQPEDIANAALFLASEESRFITGTTFTIDAGQLLK